MLYAKYAYVITYAYIALCAYITIYSILLYMRMLLHMRILLYMCILLNILILLYLFDYYIQIRQPPSNKQSAPVKLCRGSHLPNLPYQVFYESGSR